MINRNNISLSVFLSLFVALFVVMPFISSCGKTGTVAASALNIQYQVINLSPDRGPVALYINFLNANANQTFVYPTSSGYFFLTNIDTPFQIRPAIGTIINGVPVSTTPIFSIDSILKPNLKYTLFITGLFSADSVDHIFTIDTAAVPKIGRGKIRFINASFRSQSLDLVANGTSDAGKQFTQKYMGVSKYVELPAGNYNFDIYPTGSPSNILQTIQSYTIQDGRLYTLYCYGLAGHTQDSLAFGSNIIINK
jgi:hypothetical protein